MGIQLCINTADFSKNCVNKLIVWNHPLGVISGRFGWSLQGYNSARLSSAPWYGGIFIPKNGSIIISGLKSDSSNPLKGDYVYYTTSEIPTTIYTGSDIPSSAANAVGTGSNFNSSNYWFLNSDGSSDSIVVSNNYNNDYYFAFVFASATNTSNSILMDNYNLTWRYS